ncbi:MAG: hypothetical protein GY749_09365 [Desulfobacteraceae bacterium]|nr:hypothetical protein [Desulfobacteraceae bacterium]
MWLYIFIAGLILSGVTAFPLEYESKILNQWMGLGSGIEEKFPDLAKWISYVHTGLSDTNSKYPFIAYGTDWLAFAHIILAILFVGPLINPTKNIWVVEFGIIACVLVIPLAMVCGSIRGIPIFWRVIDCSFGVFGVIPLVIVRRYIKKLESSTYCF